MSDPASGNNSTGGETGTGTGTGQQPTVQRGGAGQGPEIARSLDMLLVTYVAYLIGLITALGAIVGVVIAYLNRPAVAGTWRESHYTWLIRTFWTGILFFFIGLATVWLFVGFLIWFATFVWFVIRLIKGWMAYANEEAIQKPEDWFFG